MQFVLNIPKNTNSNTYNFGKYMWYNKWWRFSPATLTTGNANPVYKGLPNSGLPSYAICRAPNNSACILFKSTATIGGEPCEDEYIWRQRTQYAPYLSEAHQANQQSTWFD